MSTSRSPSLPWLLSLPLAAFSLAFLLLPIVRLILASGEGPDGWALYLDILQNERYLTSLLDTVLVSCAVTVAALAIATTAALFLERNQ
ncbi:MAG: ABC transporter permease, partial [Pseudomonadota bacterium]